MIIILVDDMGYDDVGYHKNSPFHTPNINSIAAMGVKFTNAYVTAPQCSPSRASLLTGIYQQRFGHESNDEFLTCLSNTSNKIIPQYLKKAGYTTGMFGKWNLGDRPNPPTERGFDEAYGYFNFEDETRHGHSQINMNGLNVTGRQYATTVIFDKATKFIRSHKHQNFFIYLAPMSPHQPLVYPPKYNYIYEQTQGLPSNRRKSLAMITELDDHIGSIINTLKNISLIDKTIMFFINDNGGASLKTSGSSKLNLPLRGFKGDVYDGGVRVAMAVRWDGNIPPGKVVDVPVSTLDVLPTLLETAGIKTTLHQQIIPSNTTNLPILPRGCIYNTINPVFSATLDGVSIVDLVLPAAKRMAARGNNDQHRSLTSFEEASPACSRYLFWRFWMKAKPPRRAMRLGDWKWVNSGEKNRSDELYNIALDVGEKTDVSMVYPDLLRHLRGVHESWEHELPAINRSVFHLVSAL